MISRPLTTLGSLTPYQCILIGKETGSHVCIRGIQCSSEDRMKAEITLSVPFINGKCEAEFRNGALRRFASDIDKVQRSQTGFAWLTVIPGTLVLGILFDEKSQLILVVRYRRMPELAVDTISTFPLEAADLPVIVERLYAAGPAVTQRTCMAVEYSG